MFPQTEGKGHFVPHCFWGNVLSCKLMATLRSPEIVGRKKPFFGRRMDKTVHILTLVVLDKMIISLIAQIYNL